jgi:hypothetical protein
MSVRSISCRLNPLRPLALRRTGGLLLLATLALVGCLTTIQDEPIEGPPGPAGPQGPAGIQGPQGPAGPAGADGIDCWDLNANGTLDAATEDINGDGVGDARDCVAARVYGDGSAGPLQIESDTDWSTMPVTNLNFTDFSIEGGVALTIPSGAIIRCTGTFVNNGTIVIVPEALGGATLGIDGTTASPAHQSPEAGIARAPAGSAEIGDATAPRQGGAGGLNVFEIQARFLLHPGLEAGGGGGAAGIDDAGLRGGGVLVVRARGALTNSGAIFADGQSASGVPSGGGGGGGGLVILASGTSVSNAGAGTISARGGDGEAPDGNEAASGGGGGGIVHIIAPTINVAVASVNVTGGAGGAAAAAGTITGSLRSGGGGGGACGGNGGAGATAETDGSSAVGVGGGNGFLLQTTADPTLVF